MQVIGTVVNVEMDVQVAKKDGGVYPGSRLTYRDQTGKVAEQAFHDNAFKFNPTLKQQLRDRKVGDVIVIEKEKKGDFWNVISVTLSTGAPVESKPVSATATSSPKSTYETPEERAKKQVYIVRQSSIANAISLNPKAEVNKILETAKLFEDYVFGKGFTQLEGDESEVF